MTIEMYEPTDQPRRAGERSERSPLFLPRSGYYRVLENLRRTVPLLPPEFPVVRLP